MSAHVARARLLEVALPLAQPFAISGGVMRTRRSLIVELTDSRGQIGYGESAPFEQPFYSAETLAGARAVLSELLLPRLVGEAVTHPARAHEVLIRDVRGNPMARAGAETAWWDLWAGARDQALADVVARRLAELGVPGPGLERRPFIECGVALGIPPEQDAAMLSQWVADALARGYGRIKLKVRPGWDEEPVRVAQQALSRAARKVPLWVDANGAYRLDRDRDALRALDGLGLLFLEQPLAEDALWDTLELARALQTPICLDESLTSDDAARQVIAMEGPRIWNLKIQRVGGLDEACRIYARAIAAGVRLWGGTMPETGLGAQAMLALGGYAGFVYPSDIEPSDRWFAAGSDLIQLEMDREGHMAVPSRRPGVRLPQGVALVADLS